MADDYALTNKKPTLVVAYTSFFCGVNLDGSERIAQEVLDLATFFHDKGYYILVDCPANITSCYDALSYWDIPFSGLTCKSEFVPYCEDCDDYLARVESHIGWPSVVAVIDEDIVRLNAAKSKGVSCIHIMAGVVVSQVSLGKTKTIVREHKPSFTAGERA